MGKEGLGLLGDGLQYQVFVVPAEARESADLAQQRAAQRHLPGTNPWLTIANAPRVRLDQSGLGKH
jgi:hypothetical protein